MTGNAMKIFIVEDDRVIATNLKKVLSARHYEVVIIQDVFNVLAEFEQVNPDLVLLDVKLPGFNGFYWCKEIRTLSQVPIMFISSLSDEMDLVTAYQLGADDYVTKPINLNVFLAKVEALLRRTYDFDNSSNVTNFQGVSLNLSQAKLTWQEREIDLTRTELDIMQVLFQAQGDIVSREDIMDASWQASNFIDDNTLTVNITRLRKKLANIGLDNFIKTKRGIGYALNADIVSE